MGNKSIRRVVFMGTPDFSVSILKALINSKYKVVGVFTQPDKPKGRGGKVQMTPVKEMAMEAGIPVWQPKKIRGSGSEDILKELAPDVIVVAAFGQIIPKSILDLPPYGCINVHASLLPAYRGAAPIQWAVINGEKESGVTIMQMAEGLDTGDMISRTVVPLAADETGGSLFDKLSLAGASLLIKTLGDLENGTAVFEKQPEKSTTGYASMLKKEMGQIDWSKDAVSIERLIRGLNPWPSAYTQLNGRTLKIWKAAVVSGEDSSYTGTPEGIPGMVASVDKETFHVLTGSGILKIEEVQLEGKKRMDSAAFLRGNHLETGTVLGVKTEEK